MKNDLEYIGSSFNWITPAVAILQDIMNGPTVHFGVAALSDWDKRSIKRLLKRHGINCWGLMYTLNMQDLMFGVHRSQAKRVYAVLKEAEVPLTSVPKEAVSEKRRGLFG